MKIAVLALQGGVKEHIDHLKSLGCEATELRKGEELDEVDGLILPGGESTTMGILLKKTGIFHNLREKIINGFPVWGTCAGMILLAKNIENDEVRHLQTMDITVMRNAYGRQINSFSIEKKIEEFSNEPVPLVFIRAPYIISAGTNVKIICKVNNNIVAVRQGNMLATSFHPELTNNLAIHKYFINMCNK